MSVLALLFGSFTVPATAKAQIVGAQAQYNSNVALQSGPDIEFDFEGNTGANVQSASLFPWTVQYDGRSESFWAYCIEPSVALGNEGGTWSGKVVDSAQYTGGENKLGSTNPEAKERAEKINWIVSNSYPHLSPAEMGFPNATIPDIVPATAAAVWVISADATIDRSELEDGQLAIFDYLMNNVKPLPMDSEYSGKFIQSDAQDVVLVPPRNAPKPKISTTASFSESELVKTSPGQAPTDYVWDTVNIENIYPGYEYTLRGELFRKDANGKLRSEDVSTESFKTSDPKFTVTSENADGTVSGTIVVRLSDAEDIEKGEVGVVYERLTANGITADGLPQVGNHLIAAHEDPNDESQIVKPYWTETPTSQTSPDSPGTSNPVVPPTPATEETTTVTPTVTVTAPAVTTTQPGKTTTETQPDVTTTQPGKTTTETQPDVTTTQPGNTVVTTEPDVTTTQPGTTVTSTAPAVTVTETPTVTTTNPNETVTTTVKQGFKPNPEIRTVAEFKDGVNVVQNGSTVVDTVYYSGLVAGKSYTLDAKLVDKQDANNVLGTGAVTFKVPGTEGELANGNVKVDIAVTNAPNPVQAAVAFERLTSKEVNKAGEETDGKKSNPIAEHEDITDEDQTVRTVLEPSIATNAKFQDGSTEVVAGNTVIDTVDYEGLVPGKEYTLSAKLMERLGEAGSYEAGRVLGEGTATFTASETGADSVEVTIEVSDDVTEPVPAAVAFEYLTSTEVNAQGEDNPKGADTPKDSSDDNPIADHEDINDEAQTVEGPGETTSEEPAPTTTIQLLPSTEPSVPSPSKVTTTVTTTKEPTQEETTSEEPTPTTTIQLLPSTEPSTTSGVSTTKTAGVNEKTSTTSETSTTGVTTTDATTEATTPVTEPSTNETAPSSTPVVPLVPSNPEGKIDTKVTVNGKAIVDGEPVTVTEQDVNNGLKVTDEITYSGLAAGTKYRFEGQLQRVEFNEAGEVVKVTPVTEVKSTDVVAAENGKGTASVDFGTLTELIPGATYVVYERAIPLDGNDQPTTDPNGEPKDPSKDNRKVVEHKDPKDKAQTFEVVKTPTTTPTSPVAPSTTPDKCVPVTTVSTVPGTTVAETTVSGTTVPESTLPGTPASTVPGTTVPGTTVPGTTVAPSTVPATTLPEHCVTTTPVTTTSVTTTPVAPTTEPTQPTETVPAQPSTSEKPSKETTTTAPSSTTPVVPPVVWFPNPQIGTTADFANGAKEVVSGVVVNDTVKYQGLVPGKTYTLSAQLVSKDAFNNLADKNVYGEAIIGTGTKTFTASETGNGSEVVEITVNDGIDTPVRAAVAFETLTSTEVDGNGQDNPKGGDTPNDPSDDNPIAEHKNINDQNQTVRSPETPDTPPVFGEKPYIGTNANFATGSKQVVAGATVVDTVRYAGLVPGKTYTLTADLVTKLNGAVVGQGEKQFTASEDGFGVVDVEITVASWVKEPIYAAVAFERLTSTEVDAQGEDLPEGNRVPAQIAEHRDINDAAQTVVSPEVDKGRGVTMEPGVSTNADFANGGVVENGATVRDVVNYWGLVPGKTYTATAKLMERVGEKAPYSEGRVLGTETVTFTPKESSGTITVDIPVTNAETPVVAAVAYETITSTEVDRSGKDNPKGGDTPTDYSDDNPIAEHEDINDSFQTVTSEGDTPTTPEETTPAETPETTTEETTPAPVPSETTSTTTTPGSDGGTTPDEGSSVDRDKLWWLLLIPGLGMIPALLGGGGSSTPAPKPAPKPVPSKPAPAPAPSTSTVHTPKPAGKPVPADSPRGEIKQIPSGGTALDADMPAYI